MEQCQRRSDIGLDYRIFLATGCGGICGHDITEVWVRFTDLERIDALTGRLKADKIYVVDAISGARCTKNVLHLRSDVLVQRCYAHVVRTGHENAVTGIGLDRVRDDRQGSVVEKGLELTQRPIEGRGRQPNVLVV